MIDRRSLILGKWLRPKATKVSSFTPGSPEDFAVNVGDRCLFDSDSYEISADAKTTLDRQAAWLTKYTSYVMTIEGHCDERGTREYNLSLGAKRASAVRNYLIAQGVPGQTIRTISYGKERPIAVEPYEEAWRINRRAVTVISWR